jgi:hypothetical protein
MPLLDSDLTGCNNTSWISSRMHFGQVRLRHPESSSRVDRASIHWALALAVLPDLLHNLPVLAWAIASGNPGDWWTYAVALPGKEPMLPAWVVTLSQQLHCLFHSALVATVISGLLYVARHQFWLPLLGWWSHIIIDVFTHSADFYPSPVFYPVSSWGFDGLAWNSTWFTALNYGLGTSQPRPAWERPVAAALPYVQLDGMRGASVATASDISSTIPSSAACPGTNLTAM